MVLGAGLWWWWRVVLVLEKKKSRLESVQIGEKHGLAIERKRGIVTPAASFILAARTRKIAL